MTAEILPPADPEEMIERLRARIAELEGELSAERSSRAAAVEAAGGELEQLRAQLRALETPAAPKKPKYDGFFETE